ncbi:diadenylate cyclase CdaA [Desulfohalovibrio reitneri]|uniref:diadenylate cyclase CdaA n=1 Tax=Desulfohalovibrio reitneri TaxID=1307759 RepID=UPI0004A6DAAE|nr:diadenylate cyclase CdaA [Desulfohalovibrio reitneri]
MLDASQISWRELLDVGLVAFIYYRLILLFKGTRAVPAIYGLVLVLALYYLSGELGLYTLNWFLANFLGSIFLVIIILFQQDIRKALADVGAGRFWRKGGVRERTLKEVITSLTSMAKPRIGALVVFEQRVPLGDVIEKGVPIDAKVSDELLTTIFFHDTPLHDGAVVISGDRIKAASCILPLTHDASLSSAFGTRHRAAIGITEETDAVVLVVSEERGEISLVERGRIYYGLTEASLFGKVKEALER